MSSPTNLADPGRRLVAYIIDGFIIGAFSTVIMIIFMAPFFGSVMSAAINEQDPDPAMLMGGAGFMMLGVLLMYLLIFLYFALQHSSRHQATFGKRAMKLYVTDIDGDRLTFGKAALRSIGRFINGMTMMIGWLMVFFTDRKQGLHDMIAGTLVLDGTQEQDGEEDFERI